MHTTFVNTLALIGTVFLSSSFAAAPMYASEGRIVTEAIDSSKKTNQSSSRDDSITKSLDLARVQGSPDAKVWVIEISDMQCPYCKEWNQKTYPKLYEEFIKTGKVRFAYINFPLSGHVHSRLAAQTVMCSAQQGKFWEVKKAIFDSQEKWSGLSDANSFFQNLAKSEGVNTEKGWQECLASKPVNSLIDNDLKRGRREGVRSTPSVIVGARLVSGAVPIEDLRKLINAAIANTSK